jgi:hypothetical protein
MEYVAAEAQHILKNCGPQQKKTQAFAARCIAPARYGNTTGSERKKALFTEGHLFITVRLFF